MIIKLENIIKIDLKRSKELIDIFEKADKTIDLLQGDTFAQASFYNTTRDYVLSKYGDLVSDKIDFINLYKEINYSE